MNGYLVFTSTIGERSARTLEEARSIAERMRVDVPSFDQPRIFELLAGCAGSDCTCGGQIHPQSVEVEVTE